MACLPSNSILLAQKLSLHPKHDSNPNDSFTYIFSIIILSNNSMICDSLYSFYYNSAARYCHYFNAATAVDVYRKNHECD